MVYSAVQKKTEDIGQDRTNTDFVLAGDAMSLQLKYFLGSEHALAEEGREG